MSLHPLSPKFRQGVTPKQKRFVRKMATLYETSMTLDTKACGYPLGAIELLIKAITYAAITQIDDSHCVSA